MNDKNIKDVYTLSVKYFLGDSEEHFKEDLFELDSQRFIVGAKSLEEILFGAKISTPFSKLYINLNSIGKSTFWDGEYLSVSYRSRTTLETIRVPDKTERISSDTLMHFPTEPGDINSGSVEYRFSSRTGEPYRIRLMIIKKEHRIAGKK